MSEWTTETETTEETTAQNRTVDDDQGTEQESAAEDQGEHDPQDSDDDAEEDTADPVKAARREAGKFRRRLRETEAERDALAEQLEATRWGVVKGALRGLKTVQPLRAAGHSIEDFLDDEGAINAKAVQDIEAQFVETTGLSIRRPSDSWSQDAGKRGTSAPAEPSWSKALSPGNR